MPTLSRSLRRRSHPLRDLAAAATSVALVLTLAAPAAPVGAAVPVAPDTTGTQQSAASASGAGRPTVETVSTTRPSRPRPSGDSAVGLRDGLPGQDAGDPGPSRDDQESGLAPSSPATGPIVVDPAVRSAVAAGPASVAVLVHLRQQVDTQAASAEADRAAEGAAVIARRAGLGAAAVRSAADVARIDLDAEISLPETPTAVTSPKLPTWILENIHAPEVWGTYGDQGAGVVVGVMDSGVDYSHPALHGSWRGNDGDVASSWFAATGEAYALPGDGFGHGTHVTGSIVGGPPGEVIGVAPSAQWIAAKIFRDSGTTSTSIIHSGFQWMLAPGGDPTKAPDVVNNSWGSPATYDTDFWPDVDAWRAAGIVPMFAAGNDGPAPRRNRRR